MIKNAHEQKICLQMPEAIVVFFRDYFATVQVVGLILRYKILSEK